MSDTALEPLSEITESTAEQLLRELPEYGQRLELTWTAKGPGAIRRDVYSLGALRNILRGIPKSEVDFVRLVTWLSEMVGDKELAAAVAAVVADDEENMRDDVLQLIDSRVSQCEAILAPPTPDEDGSEQA